MFTQGIVLLACLLLSSTAVLAASPPTLSLKPPKPPASRNTWSLSVGVKPWLAEWRTASPDGSFRSRLGAMYGPAAILRYGRAFTGVTYLRGAFPVPLSSATNASSVDAETTRIDTDFTAGYYVTPYLGFIAGYKYVDFTVTVPTRPGLLGATYAGSIYETRITGPFGGVLASYSLGRTGFALYGAFTYSVLTRTSRFRQNTTDVEGTAPFWGPSAEIGLAYRVPRKSITFTQGYKFQRFEDTDAQTSDTFQGFLLSTTYTF
jgi:hypothetical protein